MKNDRAAPIPHPMYTRDTKLETWAGLDAEVMPNSAEKPGREGIVALEPWSQPERPLVDVHLDKMTKRDKLTKRYSSKRVECRRRQERAIHNQ
jgi:hypothetical protein